MCVCVTTESPEVGARALCLHRMAPCVMSRVKEAQQPYSAPAQAYLVATLEGQLHRLLPVHLPFCLSTQHAPVRQQSREDLPLRSLVWCVCVCVHTSMCVCVWCVFICMHHHVTITGESGDLELCHVELMLVCWPDCHC